MVPEIRNVSFLRYSVHSLLYKTISVSDPEEARMRDLFFFISKGSHLPMGLLDTWENMHFSLVFKSSAVSTVNLCLNFSSESH